MDLPNPTTAELESLMKEYNHALLIEVIHLLQRDWAPPVRVDITSVCKGVGVFATRDIKAGETITFYPCHAVQRSTKVYFVGDDATTERMSNSIKNGTYGMDIPSKSYTIHGDPNARSAMWAVAHLVNDPYPDVAHIKKRPNTAEEVGHAYLDYMVRIKGRTNAEFKGLESGVVSVVAFRDICKGEEVLVPYGYVYWTDLMGPQFTQNMIEYVTDPHEGKKRLNMLMSVSNGCPGGAIVFRAQH